MIDPYEQQGFAATGHSSLDYYVATQGYGSLAAVLLKLNFIYEQKCCMYLQVTM